MVISPSDCEALIFLGPVTSLVNIGSRFQPRLPVCKSCFPKASYFPYSCFDYFTCKLIIKVSTLHARVLMTNIGGNAIKKKKVALSSLEFSEITGEPETSRLLVG